LAAEAVRGGHAAELVGDGRTDDQYPLLARRTDRETEIRLAALAGGARRRAVAGLWDRQTVLACHREPGFDRLLDFGQRFGRGVAESQHDCRSGTSATQAPSGSDQNRLI
jgi:hypothetical protein